MQPLHVKQLFIFITDQCNLRCLHCYRACSRKLSLTKEAIIGILEYIDLAGLKRISFIGGEPTVHPELVNIVQDVRVQHVSRVLDTNGIEMDRVFGHLTPMDLDLISFSLDGAKEDTHEAIRGRGTFRRTLANIVTARELEYSVRITYTVTGTNILEITDMIQMANDLGAKELNLHLYCPVTTPTYKELFVSPSDWTHAVESIIRISSAVDTTILLRKGFTVDEEQVIGKNPECLCFTNDRLLIFPDGRINKCILWSTSEHFFAQHREGKMQGEILDGETLACDHTKCAAIAFHPFGRRSPYYDSRLFLTCISKKEIIQNGSWTRS